ncbi:protein GrpE [Bacillus coahuilensis m2-6]|uniref:Protein GrpE n=1 Tax=Bacillus coahuilensis p1.1.43 TaxID=1150625 RepID=A0A147K7I1_9BACI|nr:nucleotide exchange factor GrpE [Bacillus coahuilensis]KUP06038.1 protein GrpE [Bacillus coahuilensis p1.1.43]KUP07246.1 protein GrpE [Bacillus coahuilensis m2-6]
MNEETKNEQVVDDANVEEIFDEARETSTDETTQSQEDHTNELEELQKKVTEEENRYLRLQADFQNYRRRVELDREASEKYRAQSLITEILPALDNFERAMQVEGEGEQFSSLKQGMEMVYRSLTDALKKEGVEVIEAVGNPFDPTLHQAVMQGEDSEQESNVVLEEYQKGYRLKDRVIRPSMVKVNQ